MVRVFVGESSSQANEDVVWVLDANMDDLPGEVSGYVMETLFEKGALDAFFIPVQMKKNRPGVLLRVLVKEDHRDGVEEVVLRETTTLGLRKQLVTRVRVSVGAFHIFKISLVLCFVYLFTFTTLTPSLFSRSFALHFESYPNAMISGFSFLTTSKKCLSEPIITLSTIFKDSTSFFRSR